jgi:hypothetical protein
VLTVLQEIAEASAEAGTRIYFDIVAPTVSTLEFRTYSASGALIALWPAARR